MEMQILHFNTKYATTFYIIEDDDYLEDTSDSLAILSILIEIGDHNEAFEPIIHS